MALVTFSVPSEAKRAFNRLSYRKYQHTPLYLEYLPIAIGQQRRSQAAADSKNDNASKSMAAPSKQPSADDNNDNDKEANSASQSSAFASNTLESSSSSSSNPSKRDHAEEAGGEDSSNTTIYIKNLNWKTTEEAVRKFFNSVHGLKSITLLKKKKPSGILLP